MRRFDAQGAARQRPVRWRRPAALAPWLAGTLAWGGAPAAHADVERYAGYAYAVDDGPLLYGETHWLYTAPEGIAQRLVIYTCPNGEPFGRKLVDTRPGAATPDFEMQDARNGYREGVRTRQERREVFVQADTSAAERSAPLPARADAVIDAGFDAFVRAHWGALDGCGITPVPFLVPSRLGYVDFSVRRLGATDADLRWFRLALASWYGFALSHIDVGYDLRTHELRQYLGLSNIRGSGNRNLTVRIVFPAAERSASVAVADLERAAQMPLTGRCTLP